MSVRAILFDSAKPTTYQTVQLQKRDGSTLKALQSLIGGYVTLLPHGQGDAAELVAYALEDGLDAQANYMAWGVLSHLGFARTRTVVPCAHLGPVVLARVTPDGEDTDLTDADLAAVAAAVVHYKQETD